MEILTFVIEGRGEINADLYGSPPPPPARRAPSPGPTGDRSPPPPSDDESLDRQERSRKQIRAAEALNERADEMAQTIEREVRRLMPPGGGITVQADLSFYPGSIILEGTVALLYWAGRTALEPIRDELANVIKTVTRRVVNRAITVFNTTGSPAFSLGQMSVEVTSVQPSPTPAATSTAAPSPPPPQPPGGTLQDQRWLLVLVSILTLLVLILLADRLLTPSLPRNVYITPTAPSTGLLPAPPGTAQPK